VTELQTDDATLHVEVDGEGDPVMVLAHGLTNSCRELALVTPLVPGTKVRFCFRGHGHSSVPEQGYRFDDFSRDLMAVADTYGADVAVGTSLGAAAIMRELTRQPDRFRKLVFLLPTGLDSPFPYPEHYLHTVDLVDGLPREQAVEVLMRDHEREANYLRVPWLRDFDRTMLEDFNPQGAVKAIREVIYDVPLESREQLRTVTAPTLVISREGDPIHPAWAGRAIAEVMPNAELIMFGDGDEMYVSIAEIVAKVSQFLAN
jgi:pimeloyl-ACP methyl ester carboxylesterase